MGSRSIAATGVLPLHLRRAKICPPNRGSPRPEKPNEISMEIAIGLAAGVILGVVGFIAGQTAPPGRQMGHAGAIISGSSETAEEKTKAFEENGSSVAPRPVDIVGLIQDALAS